MPFVQLIPGCFEFAITTATMRACCMGDADATITRLLAIGARDNKGFEVKATN